MRLIDADALKASVQKAHCDAFQNCSSCTCLDEEQIRELIDNAPTVEQSRWIPVSERLPVYDHYGQKYWVLTQFKYPNGDIGGERVQLLRWEKTTVRGKTVERWKTPWNALVYDEALAWMPLVAPEPPKDS